MKYKEIPFYSYKRMHEFLPASPVAFDVFKKIHYPYDIKDNEKAEKIVNARYECYLYRGAKTTLETEISRTIRGLEDCIWTLEEDKEALIYLRWVRALYRKASFNLRQWGNYEVSLIN